MNTPFSTPALQEQFTDDVLALLARFGKAHQRTGNRDGELSMSHLIECLRDGTAGRRWVNLRTGGFGYTVEDMVRAAGFTVRTQRNGNAIRTYVGV